MPTLRVAFCWLSLSWLPTTAAQEPVPLDPVASLASMPAEPAVANGARIVVVAADGTPAPAAIVVFAPSDAADASQRQAEAERWFAGDELRTWAHRVGGGTRHALDERGTTRVPWRAGRVLAIADGRGAFAMVGRDEAGPSPRFELKLAAVTEFAVVVADAAGAPAAGVPVCIATTPTAGAVLATRTDADGRVAYRLLGQRPKTAVVRLEVPTRDVVSASLPQDGSAVVRLQLPATAPLRVAAVGERLPGSEVKWRLVCGSRRSFAAEPAIGAVAVFSHVEPGVQGTLQVWVDARMYEVPLPPLEPGVPAPLEWSLVESKGSLVLRVLDPTGEPARRAQVGYRWEYANGTSSASANTNPEGWLELQPPERARKGAKLRLHLRAPAGSPARAGAHELEYQAAGDAVQQLGEVRFAALPIAAAGTVVDRAGKPLPNVSFTVRTGSYSRFETAADGSFQIRLPEPLPDSLELQLDGARWFFAEPVGRVRAVSRGEAHRLVLQPAGRVRFATSGLPDGVWCDFDTHLEPASGDGAPIEVDLQFTAKEWLLPAGDWHLVFKDGNQELHRLERLHVDAGIETHDPRCMAFDWQAFAALVSIRVEDKDGKPTDACTVWHHYGVGNSSGSGRGPGGGMAYCLVPKAGGLMSIEPSDKKLAKIELGSITGQHVVRLGCGPRLRVELSASPRLPAGAELVLMLGEEHDGRPFDAAGCAEVWLPAPGQALPRIAIRVHQSDDTVWQGPSCEVPAGGLVIPLDVAGVQQVIDRRFPPKH